jgi:hypothetical protein
MRISLYLWPRKVEGLFNPDKQSNYSMKNWQAGDMDLCIRRPSSSAVRYGSSDSTYNAGRSSTDVKNKVRQLPILVIWEEERRQGKLLNLPILLPVH